MSLKELVLKNRSYRRFVEGQAIDSKLLLEWIDLARLSASAKNMQCLKYFVSNYEELNDQIFPLLKWAGYLPDWKGPASGERPAAYIVIALDTSISINPFVDHGIAMQTILLAAVESGYGGCMIASVDREQVKKVCQLADSLSVLAVLALGRPCEEIRLCPVKDDDIKYYRDKDQVHFVPKRELGDIVVNYQELKK